MLAAGDGLEHPGEVAEVPEVDGSPGPGGEGGASPPLSQRGGGGSFQIVIGWGGHGLKNRSGSYFLANPLSCALPRMMYSGMRGWTSC